ncbi:MAG: hypothetical protein NTX44_00010 [Ignavibacteriales bacterium]|nr:hypothetical protein [Ignavibacteriales bacterium]
MPTYNYPKMNWPDIKRSLSFVIPLVALVAIGPLAMMYAMVQEYFLLFLGFLTFIILIGITLGIFIRPRIQITIDNDELTLTRPGKLPTTIARISITSISEDFEGGLTVASDNSDSKIFIPKNLTKYQAVRDELHTWHPILPATPSDKSQLWIMVTIIAISGLSAIGAFIFRIKASFYVFVASFLYIFIMQGISIFKSKPQPMPKKALSPIQRIFVGLVILYFLYRIIVSFIL